MSIIAFYWSQLQSRDFSWVKYSILHSFWMEFHWHNLVTLTGAPGFEGDQFKLVQYHFHWGCSADENGSEHQIDGKSWPSELHLVHFNSTRYEKFEEACCKPDGLLVLGVFIEVREYFNILFMIYLFLLRSAAITANCRI